MTDADPRRSKPIPPRIPTSPPLDEADLIRRYGWIPADSDPTPGSLEGIHLRIARERRSAPVTTARKTPNSTLAIITDAMGEAGEVIEERGGSGLRIERDSIPGYVITREIGHGAFGTVYAASRSTSIGDFEFAVKVLDVSPFITNRDAAAARFARETKTLLRLQHRAIVSCLEAGVARDGREYIMMPLVTGRSLRDAGLNESPTRVATVFAELLNGLSYAHAQNALHRDLKPSNILVRTSDDQIQILDFGCCYLLDDANEQTLTTQMIGSLGYIPSEVMTDPKLKTAKQDIYACGIMLYEVILGVKPDPMDYEPLARRMPAFARFDSLIMDAIAPFKRRLATSSEFLERLRSLTSDSTISPLPIPLAAPQSNQRPKTAIKGLSDTDILVLRAAYDYLLVSDAWMVSPEEMAISPHLSGIPHDEIRDSLSILDGKYLKHTATMANGEWGAIEASEGTLTGFETYATAFVPGYLETKYRIAAAIVNEGRHESDELARQLNVPLNMVNWVFKRLEAFGLLKISDEIGVSLDVYNISIPKLRRAVQERTLP